MIISFSGPHGAGKSSLINAIQEAWPQTYATYPDRLSFVKTDDPLTRTRSKLVRYYHERLDQEKYMKETGKHVLADRCVYDLAYGRAFVGLGWLNPNEQQVNEQIAKLLFPAKPDCLVVLNPPLESIEARLRERWSTKDKKWKETDLNYLQAVHAQYKAIDDVFEGKHLLKIEDAMTLGQEVKLFADWTASWKGVEDLALV